MSKVCRSYGGSTHPVTPAAFVHLAHDHLPLKLTATSPPLAQEVCMQAPVFLAGQTNFSDVVDSGSEALVATNFVPIVLDEQHIDTRVCSDRREEIGQVQRLIGPWVPYGYDGDLRSDHGVESFFERLEAVPDRLRLRLCVERQEAVRRTVPPRSKTSSSLSRYCSSPYDPDLL